jgi:hypothetical protein
LLAFNQQRYPKNSPSIRFSKIVVHRGPLSTVDTAQPLYTAIASVLPKVPFLSQEMQRGVPVLEDAPVSGSQATCEES